MIRKSDLQVDIMSSLIVQRGVELGWFELASYYWDRKKGSYIDQDSGKKVPESLVRGLIENTNTKYVHDNISKLTQQMVDGKLKLADWQVKMAKELKNAHVANLAAGKGGRAGTNFSDWGKVGSRLKFQYKQLNLFADAIKAGHLTSRQIQARANMYANSVRTSYYDGLTRAKIEAGFKWEKRVTTTEAPCASCERWASAGWQPVGTVPEPGIDCEGFTNCKCHKTYRKKRP